MLDTRLLLSLCLGVVVVGQNLNGVHISPKFGWTWSKRSENNGHAMMKRGFLEKFMTPDKHDHHRPLVMFDMDPSLDLDLSMSPVKKWSEENALDYL